MLENNIFRKNLCEVLPTKKETLLWRLSFRMGSFAKDCLQPLVKRVSIKTLKYSLSYIFTYRICLIVSRGL